MNGMEAVERKKEQERGAIVVEATIALTTFMFLIVTLLSIVNICLVQAKVGTLINGVAKDLSYYSYIYSVTGVGEKEKSVHEGSKQARSTVEVLTGTEDVATKLEALGVVFKKEFWESVKNLLLDEAVDAGKGVLLNKLCQGMAKDRLEMSTNDADSYLQKLGIQNGVSGLNFTCSEFCNGGSNKIKVVCVYQVHMLRLLNVDLNFHFCQTAETRAWGSAQTLLSAYNNSHPEESEETPSEEPADEEEQQEEQQDENGEEQTEETKPKTTDQYVNDNTHNGSSNQVMLGQMSNGTGSYASKGSSMDMTYLSISEEDWAKLAEQGVSKQTEVINQYMQNQEYAGKKFYMKDDPEYATGCYYDQVAWLRAHGYKFKFDAGIGLYVAVRDEE